MNLLLQPRYVLVLCLLGGLDVVWGHGRRHLERQSTCGTPEPTDNDQLAQQWAVDQYQARGNAYEAAAARIIIPVCFQKVLFYNGTGHVTNKQLQKQLNALNKAFGATSCCDPSVCAAPKCSVDTGFTFAMATLDESGNVIPGVTTPKVADSRACVTTTYNDNWAAGEDMETMQITLRKGDSATLNFFTVRLEDAYLGYANFPWGRLYPPIDNDGVVVDSTSLPGGTLATYNEGDSAVHVVGHWLGLAHPFHGGCDAGDGIDDTPPEAIPYYGSCNRTYSRNTCPGGGRGKDPIQNFMDLSQDKCRFQFTAGQRTVMQACFNIFRLHNGNDFRPIIPLQLNQLSDPINLAPFGKQVYRINLRNVSKSVTCTTYADEGDADLYVRVNDIPTFTERDCCYSYTNLTSYEQCTVKRQPQGSALLSCRQSPQCSDQQKCKVSRKKTLYAGVFASTKDDLSTGGPVLAVQGLQIVCAQD